MKYVNKIANFLAKNTLISLAIVGIVAGVASFSVIRGLGNDKIAATNCESICVSLKSDGMFPNELAVKTGQIVQFNSADGEHHNISEGDGAHGSGHGHGEDKTHEHVGDYLSGEFGPDEAWRVQFNKAGTYKLHDHYNPKQSILVVVYDER